MSRESFVMALLEEGNPATELGDHAWSHLDATAYLATLHERSSEVTQLDTRPGEATRRTRRGWALGLSAVVAVVLVVLLATLVGGDEAPPVDEPVPSTTVVTQTTIDEAEAAWEAIPPSASRGSGRTVVFEPAFSIAASGDWQSVRTSEDYFVIRNEGTTLSVITWEGSVEDAVTMFSDVHQTLGATMTQPAQARVGAAEGLSFDSSGLPVRVETTGQVPWASNHDGFSGRLVPGGSSGVFYVVDVAGQTVIVIYGTEEGLEETREYVMAINDTFTWKDLD